MVADQLFGPHFFRFQEKDARRQERQYRRARRGNMRPSVEPTSRTLTSEREQYNEKRQPGPRSQSQTFCLSLSIYNRAETPSRTRTIVPNVQDITLSWSLRTRNVRPPYPHPTPLTHPVNTTHYASNERNDQHPPRPYVYVKSRGNSSNIYPNAILISCSFFFHSTPITCHIVFFFQFFTLDAYMRPLAAVRRGRSLAAGPFMCYSSWSCYYFIPLHSPHTCDPFHPIFSLHPPAYISTPLRLEPRRLGLWKRV